MTSIPSERGSSARVLVIDDDRFMRAYIDGVLREAELDVVATDADNAVELLDTEAFDLIICDRTMPGRSGEEVLSLLRSRPKFDLIPFIFVTVSDDIADVVSGLDRGADDYIIKPFDPEELTARVQSRLNRGNRGLASRSPMVDIETFAFELDRELVRARRGGEGATLAIIDIPSLKAVEQELGDRERRKVLEEIAGSMGKVAESLDLIGATSFGDMAVLLPGLRGGEAADRLQAMATAAASLTTVAAGVKIRPIPVVGFFEFGRGCTETAQVALEKASGATRDAYLTQDLQPRRWVHPDDERSAKTDHHPLREATQVLFTMAIGVVAPFIVYVLLYELFGIDASWPVYLAAVVALVSTAALIWTEGIFALRHPGPPTEASTPEPPATAIICAYLPNEADTIVETIEHFLSLDYPAGLQVILAYNTPRDLPVEDTLRALASQHQNLLLLRVAGSNSKAQNLNAALARATGEFIGVFDADHHPDEGSFQRAWKWLSNGFQVVQGHCLVRNPDETFLARMVAVEFETIYAVNHPGRWMRDGFGIFGGSNGYWRTDVLHLTRMRGSMLTEDIDSSMRVIEAGGEIASDPGLISRELATTTARQIWNQRLRWSQGWTQVSLRHLWSMLSLPHFDTRRRLGVFMLLFQREVYPWLSLQIFPLVAFWIVRGDTVDWLIPLFVAATIFTTSVGPGMTLVAYKLSHPTIKRKSWFWQYALFGTFVYTEAKNVIARVGHLKEALGESSWRITPRTADPGRGVVPLAAVDAHPGSPNHGHARDPSVDYSNAPADKPGELRITKLPAVDEEVTAAVLEAAGSPTARRAATRLGVDPADLSFLAFALWGRSLSDERDARADALSKRRLDEPSLRGLKGHVTRELMSELEPHTSAYAVAESGSIRQRN